MKKTLSIILAALLLASSVVSCGKTEPSDTKGSETNAPATEQSETDPVETDAPAPSYDASLVTENGVAKAHIVIPDNAEYLVKYGADELVYHIKKVSGAEVSVTNTVMEGSLPILIATPDSHPELEALFPEDIAWLRTLEEEDGRRWGDDGFAIRTLDGKIYIFGITAKGALNGVYDFIEENMGVLWIRADEDFGLIYEEQATVTVLKTDYREKSPFMYRGWTLCGNAGEEDRMKTEMMLERNKLNSRLGGTSNVNGAWLKSPEYRLETYNINHHLKGWVLTSPLYDPSVTEYWCTDSAGIPSSPSDSTQINFWSDLTAQTVAASMLDFLSVHGDVTTLDFGIEDNLTCICLPYSNQPYEYAPGQFVEPNNSAYLSTVFYSFMNKVARLVAEKYPEVNIVTYAYVFVEQPPLCELEDNISIVIAPILEDMADNLTDPNNANNADVIQTMEKWKAFSNDILIYNYYGCSFALSGYERPIWYRISSDLQYYVDCGFVGLLPEGVWDGGSSKVQWDMNTLTFWLYSKLSWNPYEDVDSLIRYFCDRVYGNASEDMQEYYSLIYKGWIEGESEVQLWNYKHKANYYLDFFVFSTDLETEIIAALRNAYDSADDAAKERIRYIKESYEAAFPEE